MKQVRTIARTQYQKGYWLTFKTDWNEAFKGMNLDENELKNDIQVCLEDDKGNIISDAICKWGSYGVAEGLWELMSEDFPKNWHDNVMGYITWKEVMKYFDKTVKRLNKAK